MTSEPPKVNPSGLYGLNEASRILGVSRSTLSRAARSQDKTRSIPCHIRKATGKRVFKGKDIINYWLLTY